MRINFEVLDSDAEKYYLNEDNDNKFVKDQFIEHAFQEYYKKWLKDKINYNENALALGYGDGVITDFLSKNYKKLNVVEGSKLLIENARKKHSNINFIHALFEDFIPNEKYDIIFATYVFEHIDEPVKLLEKMKNWLNINGKIIIIVPNKESIHRKLAVLMGLQPELDTLSERDKNVGHQRVYSFETLERDVSSAGYSVEERYAFTLKFLPNSMMLEFPNSLITALNEISPEIPLNLMANIAIVIKNNNKY